MELKKIMHYDPAEIDYDQQVMNLMSGPRPSFKDYQYVIKDSNLLDQLCANLIMKLKLNPESINELVSLLPRADHFDFFAFRIGKINLDQLKLRTLDIDPKFLKTREDLILRGVPLEYFVLSDLI